MLTFGEFCDESLDEAIRMKRRVRKGKIQRAKVSSKKGKGWTVKNGREVRISPTELKKMSLRNNNLTQLEIENKPSLFRMLLQYNELTSLTVKNVDYDNFNFNLNL